MKGLIYSFVTVLSVALCTVNAVAEGSCHQYSVAEQRAKPVCDREISLEDWGAASVDCKDLADLYFASTACGTTDDERLATTELEGYALLDAARALAHFDQTDRASVYVRHARNSVSQFLNSKDSGVRDDARDFLKNAATSVHELLDS